MFILAEYSHSIAYGSIYVGSELSVNFLEGRGFYTSYACPFCFCTIGYVIFCRKLRHWSSFWSHRCLQWRPCQRPCHRWRGKVTGATQMSVSAVSHIPYGWTSVCTVQKPNSVRDLPMQSSSKWVRPQLGRANSFLALRIYTKRQVWDGLRRLCVFLYCSDWH